MVTELLVSNANTSTEMPPVEINMSFEEEISNLSSVNPSELETSRKQVILLQEQIKRQEIIINEQNEKLKQLEKVNKKLTSDLTSEKLDKNCMEASLNKFLSKSQRDIIFGRKKKVVWTSEDVGNAFAIRYFSKECYVYLREKKKYPLPALSSLQRWASNINLRQGILKDIFRIMEIAQNEMTDLEKIVVLQFDEVKVKKCYEYDKAADEVVGPHMQMQIVMVRGLFAKYKQPIFIGFDTKMTQQILIDIITHLYAINYKVVACVSDCGGGNMGLWKDLNINITNTHFQHPVTGDNIYFFADPPHLLKLIRNWLLDYGFILGDGSEVNAVPIKKLVDLTNTEVNSCFKIKKNSFRVYRTNETKCSTGLTIIISHHSYCIETIFAGG